MIEKVLRKWNVDSMELPRWLYIVDFNIYRLS